MPTFDSSDATVEVYARRQSDTLLASMGHDIVIEADDFSVELDLDEQHVEASFDPASLRPVDAIKWETGQRTGELSEGDRHEIEQRMQQEVLDVEDFDAITFASTSVDDVEEGWQVTGDLELHGETREITFDVERDEGCAVVETTLDHTDWEIEPYSAMLGSLKVDPEVVVRVEVPLPNDD